MKLLLIGGSVFVGRHLLDAAIARGDQVSVFNRGQSPMEWPASVDVRHGDRKEDFSALADGEWDAVIDCCGYLPLDVARMADGLHGRVGRYVFISSISVYADFAQPNDEDSALGRIDDTDTEVVDGRSYGPLKALCEEAATARFGRENTLVIRPGLIVGPHDPTERFTYWPARIARAAHGEAVLAPGTPETPVQFIDVRDLAGLVLHAIDTGCHGPMNATSPPGAISIGALLQTCADVAGTAPALRWVSAKDVERCGLAPWSDLPVWVPPVGDHAAMHRTSTARAQAAGLRTRELRDTVAATLAWYRSLPSDRQAFTKAGLSPAREAEALAALNGAPR